MTTSPESCLILYDKKLFQGYLNSFQCSTTLMRSYAVSGNTICHSDTSACPWHCLCNNLSSVSIALFFLSMNCPWFPWIPWITGHIQVRSKCSGGQRKALEIKYVYTHLRFIIRPKRVWIHFWWDKHLTKFFEFWTFENFSLTRRLGNVRSHIRFRPRSSTILA